MKSLVIEWNVDIICLQETKLEGNLSEVVKQIWGGRWVTFACLEASGTRGGILLLGDSRVWQGMREFSDVIEDLKLVDIQLEDCSYTWFKGVPKRQHPGLTEYCFQKSGMIVSTT